MMYFQNVGSKIDLQATLAASSAAPDVFNGGPHHPITCQSKLAFEEDGTFKCEHSEASPNDPRTKQILNHSMAILLIELAHKL